MHALALVALFALSGAPTAPPRRTQLKLDVKPETAVVYVDGKKKGTGAKEILLTVEPGRHIVKVVNGGDAHEEMVVVKKGEVTKWAWAFEDERADRKRRAEEAKAKEDAAGASEDGAETVP